MIWEKLSEEQINQRIEKALNKNTSFHKERIFGVPASWLNKRVFPKVDFLKKAPYLRTMFENPNHIGCHTEGSSEEFFTGTQEIEREMISIIAEDILLAEPNSYDGYVPSGGTEGNIQGVWAFRNYYMEEYDAKPSEIYVISTRDTHYSIHKACNLLCLNEIICDVNNENRQIDYLKLQTQIDEAKSNGAKYFITVLTMGTTMFGRVDDVDQFIDFDEKNDLKSLIHIDAAFGGFIYPFSMPDNSMTFKNDRICSMSLDAHKMLQAPYGTGIYISKRPWLKYVTTGSASYVSGNDKTLCGSRSGANAVSIWMILSSYSKEEWSGFINSLISKTDYICSKLKEKNIDFYREEGMNIITIPAKFVDAVVAKDFLLVPDSHDNPNYYKAVVMEHLKDDQIEEFLKRV